MEELHKALMRRNRFLIAGIFSHALALGVSAFNWAQDSLAVRLTLNENGLYNVSVGQVATRIQDRVQKLRFDSLPIYVIGYEIFTLDSLKSLSLVKCGLKSLPATMAQWSNLEELDLSGNLLSHLPLEIGSLTHLSIVNLRDNALRTLPDTLCNLKSLIYLDVSENLISALPAQIDRLQNLTYLYANQDSLVTLPESIALLPFLKELNVSGNRISSLPYTMAAMSSLEVLDASINDLTALPDEWVLLTTLKSLDVGSNQLCGLSAPLSQWVESKQPGWLATQFCVSEEQSGLFSEQGKLFGWARFCPEGIWLDANWATSITSISVINALGQMEYAPKVAPRIWRGQAGWLVEKPKDSKAGGYLQVATPAGQRVFPWFR
jgi:Leucine-rich repeat (LRR) protein